MPYLIAIALIIGVLWLIGQAIAFLVAVAAVPAAMLAAPSVPIMKAINASLGLPPYNSDPYVLLHALLGGAVGLSAHMMVRRFRLEGKVGRAWRVGVHAASRAWPSRRRR